MVDSDALPHLSYPAPGTPVRNVHTGTEDVVEKVARCDVLDGRTRIWLTAETVAWPNNGWDPGDFARCWRTIE